PSLNRDKRSSSCLQSGLSRRCPPNWHVLSTPFPTFAINFLSLCLSFPLSPSFPMSPSLFLLLTIPLSPLSFPPLSFLSLSLPLSLPLSLSLSLSLSLFPPSFFLPVQ